MGTAAQANPMREWLIGLLVLTVVVVAGMWARDSFSFPSPVKSATAATLPQGPPAPGVPDSGQQFLTMVEELKALNVQVRAINDRLTAIDKALRDGEYKVKSGKAEGGQ
jgi:hypothetical protein